MSNPDPMWSFSIRCGPFSRHLLRNFHHDSATSKFGLGLEEAAQLADSAASWWLSFNPFEKYAHQIGSFPQRGEKNVRFHHPVLTMGADKAFATCSFFVVWPSTHEKYCWVPIPPLLSYWSRLSSLGSMKYPGFWSKISPCPVDFQAIWMLLLLLLLLLLLWKSLPKKNRMVFCVTVAVMSRKNQVKAMVYPWSENHEIAGGVWVLLFLWEAQKQPVQEQQDSYPNRNSEVKKNDIIFNLSEQHKRWTIRHPHWKSKERLPNTKSTVFAGLEFAIIDSYCWWLKSWTTWDVWNPINQWDKLPTSTGERRISAWKVAAMKTTGQEPKPPGGRGSFFLRKVMLQTNQIQTQVGWKWTHIRHVRNELPTIHQSCLTSWICWCHWLSIYSLWQTFCPTSDAVPTWRSVTNIKSHGPIWMDTESVHQCHMTPVGRQPWAKHCHMSHI